MPDRLNLLDRPGARTDGLAGGVFGGITLPGTAGNYVSSPDSVLNSVTGDIDIRVCAKADDWTPVTTNGRALVAKGNGNSYNFSITSTGALSYWYNDGVTARFKTSTAVTGFADGTTNWVRATHDVDNGAGGNDVKFYTSSDGITWTQLGTTVTTVGVVAIADSAFAVQLGANGGLDADAWSGTIYYCEIRAGIDGPVAAKFDASAVQSSGAQVPAAVNGWTVNGSALYRRDDYIRLSGTAMNWLSYPDTVANSVTGDIDLRAKVSADDWTPAGDVYVLAKEQVGLRSYCLGLTATTGVIHIRFSTDGSATVTVSSSAAPTVADGAMLWIRATRQASTGNCNFYTSPDGTTWALLGTADRPGAAGAIHDNASVIELGSRAGGGSNNFAGNIYAAEVRSGIGGDVVASFDARDITTPWTVNGTGWSWEGASFAGKPTTALDLSGVDYVTTPDSAGNSVVGDIDIRVKAAADSWNTGATQTFAAKYGAAGQRSWRFGLASTGGLNLIWSADGTATTSRSSADIGLAAGATKWVRAAFDVDGYSLQFYTSDDGIAWTPFGAALTGAATSIFDSTAPVEIGAYQAVNSPLAGTVHYAEVRNGIDGPIVARFDPTAIARTGTRTPTTTVQPGGTPNLLTPNIASIETDTTGWFNETNATIARSTAQFLDGAASLSITSTAIAVTAVRTATGTSGVPVVAGKLYLLKINSRAATVGRSTTPYVKWYNAAGGLISSVNGGAAANTTTGWTEVTATLVAPALAAYATVQLNIDGTLATEVHYIDRISLVESAATWTMNGSAWDLVQVA